MTVDADVFCDVEGALRTYARADSTMQATFSQRGYFGVPDSPVFPLYVIRRVGGGDDSSTAPLDLPLVQWDVWGGHTADGIHGNKAKADEGRRAVRRLLYRLAMQGATALDTSTVSYGALVLSDIWLPDPDDDNARYSITAQHVVRAA